VAANDYFALLAYVRNERRQRDLRCRLFARIDLGSHTRRDLSRDSVRDFLHSTGQAYKGGANNWSVSCRSHRMMKFDLPVRDRKYTFGVREIGAGALEISSAVRP
jgi:hypothetical protein